jgi:hypothetical protein
VRRVVEEALDLETATAFAICLSQLGELSDPVARRNDGDRSDLADDLERHAP